MQKYKSSPTPAKIIRDENFSIFQCDDEHDIEIVGGEPEEGEIKLGIRRKAYPEEIFVVHSKEVAKRWPYLLIKFYEDNLQFLTAENIP